MAHRGRQVLSDYRELAIVAVAAAVGLTVQGPLAWAVRHQGIDILLVILVFFTALTIEPRTLRDLPVGLAAPVRGPDRGHHRLTGAVVVGGAPGDGRSPA